MKWRIWTATGKPVTIKAQTLSIAEDRIAVFTTGGEVVGAFSGWSAIKRLS